MIEKPEIQREAAKWITAEREQVESMSDSEYADMLESKINSHYSHSPKDWFRPYCYDCLMTEAVRRLRKT